MNKHYKLYGFRDAYQFLEISDAQFFRFIKKYDIPCQKTSHGRVFFEEDLHFFRDHWKKGVERISFPKAKRPSVLGYGDAHKFIEVSHPRFFELMEKYDIPFQQISSGRVFFEDDLKEFQKARSAKMKHGRKEK